jgi:hypothetical protein
MTSIESTHPLRIPTPPRGIRQVEYVGRHRLREPEPVVRASFWRRAVRALGITKKPEARP